MRVNINNLPVYAEFYEVPYLIYEDEKRGPVAINDFATESGLLPEILFEGEQITQTRFIELSMSRAKGSTKYKEILEFYESFSNEKKKDSNSLEKTENYREGQSRDKSGRFKDEGGSKSTYADYSGDNWTQARKNYGEWATENSDYSETEQSALEYYRVTGYQPVNDILRYGFTTDENESRAKDTIKLLDTAKKLKLVEDTSLWRGGQFDSQVEVGDKLTDKAYSSTSFDREVALDFAKEQGNGGNKYIFKINAPKGTEGIFIGNQELEWLLNKNSSFTVKSVSAKDDDDVSTVEVSYE